MIRENHMDESGRELRRRDWLWVFALLGILAVSVLWYLQQNPRFLYSLVVACFVAIAFLVLLALRPEYRQALIRRLLGLHNRDLEAGGWFNRYGRLAGILLVINSLIFRLMLQYQLVSSQQPHFVLAFIYIQMALVIVLLVSLLRMAEKQWWRYPLIALLILTLAVVVAVTALLLLELLLH
jgi:hypothetical protein